MGCSAAALFFFVSILIFIFAIIFISYSPFHFIISYFISFHLFHIIV